MLNTNKIYYNDSFELIKQIDNNSIDLIVTSPPYANTTSYGKDINTYHPKDYNDWIMPLIIDIGDKLKDTGSFILNINDKIQKGYRSIYVFDLVVRIVNETKLNLYDRYIWFKKSGLPTGGNKRLNDKIEYIFHFTKTKDHKAFTDRIRIPYSDESIKRMKKEIMSNKIINNNGITSNNKKMLKPNDLGKKPDGVFRFNTAGVLKGKSAGKHPATYHYDLPYFFIKWLTNENDIVLDPFLGTGTTAQVSKKLNRKYIGFELNRSYEEIINLKLNDMDINFSTMNNIFRN